MASRFNSENIHQRDPRSALFSGYTPSSTSRNASPAAPSRYGGGYGYGGGPQNGHVGGGYGAGSIGAGAGTGSRGGTNLGVERTGAASFRPATPNRRGQYSDAVLNELESQNDAQVEGILGKVKVLKEMTVQIGDEIRESSALAEKMNDAFDNTRVRLRGTMNRMLVMAQKTGIGWRAWLAFFGLIIFLFTYVWLF